MDWSEQQAKYGALVQPRQTAQAPAATTPAPQKSGGLSGFLMGAARGIAHPFAELGTAAAYLPKTVAREIENKPVNDIQKRVFGTSDSGSIAKKVIGDTAQVGLSAVTPGAGSITKNALLGAGFGASSALAGDNSSVGDVIKGGLTGGVTGGAVGAAGNILSKLGGGVEKVVENGAAKTAAKTAEKETIQKAAQAAQEEAPYAAISKTGRENGGLRSTLDFFKNTLKTGTNPEDLRNAANLVTGENGVASGTVRKLLGDVGTVPTSDVLDRTKAALTKEVGRLGDVETRGSTANDILRSIRDTMQSIAYKGEGNLSKNGAADANAVFDTLQSVEDRIRELGNEGVDVAEKRALKATKSALEDTIYNNGALDKAVAAHKLAPEDISAVYDTARKSGVSDETAKHVIDGINNATSGKELRGLQRPFVNASKLADVADRAGEGTLTKVPKESAPSGMLTGRNGRYTAMEAASLLGGNPVAALPLAANVAPGMLEKGSNIFQKVAGGAVNKAKTANGAVPGGANNVLSKLLNESFALSGPENQPAPQPQANPAPEQPLVDNTGTANNGSTSSDIFSADNVQRLVLEDLAKNGGKNASLLLSLYNTFGKPKEASPAEKKSLVAAKNAEDTLSQIESSFKQAGGGQGLVGGNVSNIFGKVGANSDVATYNDTATALAASLYKALGNTGTISDKDQALIAKLIPKTTDTDTTANAKIGQLRNLLQQAESNLTAVQ